MPQLILLRHGESLWNRDSRFTGWTDVDLTERGVEEARGAARLMTMHCIAPDVCFTSVLKRAIRTLWIVLDDMDLLWTPVERDWRLNERHYGALQGLHKGETAAQVGEELVHRWRRSFAVRPPALESDDPRHPRHERRYRRVERELLPATESLKDTVERFMPCWEETIAPRLRAGEVVLVSAHGNSMRAMVKHLDGISGEDIPGLEIPTGVPLLYELDDALKPVESRYLEAPSPEEGDRACG